MAPFLEVASMVQQETSGIANYVIRTTVNNVVAFQPVNDVLAFISYRLSFCIGVTHFDPKSRTSINDLMAEADEALYKNKRARTVVGRLPLASEEKSLTL